MVPWVKTITVGLVTAMLALSPGIEAWAAVARVSVQVAVTGPGGLAAAGGAVSPLKNRFTGINSPGTFTPGSVLPGISEAPAISAAVSPETVAVLPKVAIAVSPGMKTISSGDSAAAPKVAPSARQNTAAQAKILTRQSGAIIEAIGSRKASSSGLKTAGGHLIDVLTGAKRRASAAGVVRPRAAAWKSGPHALFHEGHDHGSTFDAEVGGKDEVPAPEITPQQEQKFRLYKFGVSATKLGIETLHVAIPLLVLTQFGSVTAVGTMVIGANLAGMIAGWAASPLVDRWRPSRILAGASLLQAALIGVIPILFFTGSGVGLGVLSGIYIASGALSGIIDIARRAAMPHILGRHEGTLREYNGRLYILREIAGISGDAGAGWIAKTAGFFWALILHPISYLVAAFQFFRLAKISPKGEVEPAEKRETFKDRVAAFFEGAKLVLKDPGLRTAALVNIPVLVLHQLFHTMLAAVYATKVLGNPMLAAVLLIAWNVGELVSAWLLKKYGKKGGSFRWLAIGAVASLSAWLLWLFPNIWVATPVVFFLAASTLSNELGLASYFQSRAEREKVGAVTGFVYSLSTAASMLALFGMGRLFDALPAETGFLVLAAILSLVAVFYLFSWRILSKVIPTRMAKGIEKLIKKDPTGS